jgi:hypothetical protein
MRFALFIIIAFGLFLLTLGMGDGGTTGGMTERLTREYLNAAAQELLPGAVKVANPNSAASDEADQPAATGGTEADTAAVTEIEEEQLAAGSLDLDTVLTRGEEYSRDQLVRYSNAASAGTGPAEQPTAPTQAQTMRDIHSLNRDALATLSRVDAVLHGKNTGAKQ